MRQGAHREADQAMPPQLGGHETRRRPQLPAAAHEDVQRAGDVARPALPLDGQGRHGRIERPGPGFVGDPVALLNDVERRPQIVDGDVGGDGTPGLGADGGELAHQADRRAQPVLSLLQPRLEPPVQALAPSAVVFELLAGHRTHLGIGKVLHHRGEGTGGKAVVGVADHHDWGIGLHEAPVEGLGLAEPLLRGQGAGARSLRGRRGLGIPVGDHEDPEAARIAVRPEVVQLVGDHTGLPVGRHQDGEVRPCAGCRGCRRGCDPAAAAAGAPRQPRRIEDMAGGGAGDQCAHRRARSEARPAHPRTSSVTSTPRKVRVPAGVNPARRRAASTAAA